MNLDEKKILFVVPTLTSGGAERVVSILATSLAQKGENISLLLNERCTNEYPIDEKVRVYTIPEEVHRKEGVSGKLSRIRSRYIISKQINPDITITFLNDTIQFLCNIPLKGKFVSTVRLNPRSGNVIQRTIKYITVWLSDACLVQNNEQKRYFNKLIQRKIFILPNPIKQENFAEEVTVREHLRKVITLGRLTKQKNHQLLIKAFKLVHDKNTELTLEIYGQGEERENLETLIKELQLQNSVFLKGRTLDAKKSLMDADLFVLSSDYEGMPNALLEAMAAGIPSISTDCPTGPSDIIDDDISGLLVQTNNIDEMAKAIRKMEDVEFRRKVSVNAYNYVRENYSVDRVVECLREKLKEIVSS